MIVVKGGWIQLVNYRRAHLRLARTMSDLARELKRRFGWILQFANIENKIHCDAISGAQSDQHGHMIVTGPRIGRRQIKLLETFVRRFMKSAGYQEYCHVSSIQSENIERAVAYSFDIEKRGSLANLLSPNELADFYWQTRGLRFFRPAGGFRHFRRELNPVKEIIDATGQIQRAGRPGRRPVRWFDDKTVKMKWRLTDRARSNVPTECVRNGSSSLRDIVLALQLPSACFSERMTTAIVVQNYGGDFVEMVLRQGPEFEVGVNKRRIVYNERVIRGGHPELAVPLLDFHEIRRLRAEAAEMYATAKDKIRVAAFFGVGSSSAGALFADAKVLEVKAAALIAQANTLVANSRRRQSGAAPNLHPLTSSTPKTGITPHSCVMPSPVLAVQAQSQAPP
jgi:hypothetical protein